MSSQALTVSIIIPAFNEEHHISQLLRSIALQSVKPYEVIVVDNNSTDKTVLKARSFPFVKVINESQQGLIPARDSGFNQATGQVLGRINADVILQPNWVSRVQANFAKNHIDGLSGPAVAKFLPLTDRALNTYWSRVYLRGIEAYFRQPIMWGANMAISYAMWQKIKDQTSKDDRQVHEDQDLSVLIAKNGGSIKIDRRLLVTTFEKSYIDWPKFQEYQQRRRQTKAWHKQSPDYSSTRQKHRLPSVLTAAVLAPTYTIWTVYSFGGQVLKKTGRRILKN